MKNILQILFILMLSLQTMNAQNDDTKKADKHFNRLEFVDAIKSYEKLISKDKANAYVYKQLAIANYNISNTKESERYYEQYFKNAENPQAEDYFNYAQILLSNKKYDKAKKAYQDFATKAPNDSRAKAFLANKDFVQELQNMAPNYEAKAMDLNSEYSDFGGYENDTYFYFVSSRNKSRRTYGWNDQPTTDIYKADNVAGTFKNEKLLEGDVNTKFNEGTIAISNDGQTLYFTRNDYLDGDYEKSEDGIGQLKIYQAKKVNGEWKDIKALPFTSSEYSVSHPALSPDNSTLYFSSNMDGGYGKSDLYMVSINDDGSFGEPKNLGSKVNTPARESFPFVDADNKLFFSSDGHLGLGGLDVFHTSMNNGSYAKPENLGAPINSSNDDFAFSYFNQVDRGYVSSNRGENPLNDNIYQVKLIKPLDETNIIVNVLNNDTDEPLKDASVLFYDDDDNEIASLTTDINGQVQEIVISNLEYDIQANLKDFESDSKTITAIGDLMEVDLRLKPIEVIIEEREVTLSNILFDFDKASIRPEVAFELDKIVATLKKYPDLVIRIESHTDIRGSKIYNQNLSEARAKNTLKYLVDKGIDESRLSAVGKGETEPVIDCSNGCTEKEHEKNRRSKFIIVE
ncbi:OmpA family protein [Flavobacterium sp. CS20]|uniref:OmpA family protein n=1 Tax=Flavobacterium sp. CS20 TaxID=2775246 RepID=UPI001B3A0E4B|nr:OmpA family protein [Flavobacterium sp. CS20]QTY26289.1 OmpA family protein [Flavobacterium sp. CS20]